MRDEELEKLAKLECAKLLKSEKGYNGLSFQEFWAEGVKYGLSEGKPKWHNLRKDPNDLPDGGRRVLVKDKSRKEYDIACFCRNGITGFWSYERFISHIEDNYVIAWCDFPRFEE